MVGSSSDRKREKASRTHFSDELFVKYISEPEWHTKIGIWRAVVEIETGYLPSLNEAFHAIILMDTER